MIAAKFPITNLNLLGSTIDNYLEYWGNPRLFISDILDVVLIHCEQTYSWNYKGALLILPISFYFQPRNLVTVSTAIVNTSTNNVLVNGRMIAVMNMNAH